MHERRCSQAASKNEGRAQVDPKLSIRVYMTVKQLPGNSIFEAAAQMQKDLAEHLRAEGYTVTGGAGIGSTFRLNAAVALQTELEKAR